MNREVETVMLSVMFFSMNLFFRYLKMRWKLAWINYLCWIIINKSSLVRREKLTINIFSVWSVIRFFLSFIEKKNSLNSHGQIIKLKNCFHWLQSFGCLLYFEIIRWKSFFSIFSVNSIKHIQIFPQASFTTRLVRSKSLFFVLLISKQIFLYLTLRDFCA